MSHGRSEVRFTNSTPTKIYVAYMRRDFGCQDECGDPWDVLGWINLDPGETETRANSTKNQWFYHYAEGADGRIYSGPYPGEVKQSVFEKCTCLGVIVVNGPPTNPYHTVGFRVLDTVAFSGVNYT
jgi:Protein of unknown function (DUF1036)